MVQGKQYRWYKEGNTDGPGKAYCSGIVWCEHFMSEKNADNARRKLLFYNYKRLKNKE